MPVPDLWILVTIAAAAFQTVRFMLQKHLATATLSAGGATFSRFLYSLPFILALMALYTAMQGHVPALAGPSFWGFGLLGATSQILATVCVVLLFKQRNFAVGITFKKTEVILTAIVGWIVLGDRVSGIGALALVIGLLGVLWLSDPPGGAGQGATRLLNRAAGLGLLSGVFFAVSAVGYRGAVLAVGTEDTALKAGVTLAVVTLAQSVALGAWLALREPGELARVIGAWRVALPTGVLSMIGSFCWFAAFSLQTAAYVFALGQVELIFSILAATLWFRETITRREFWGMAVLTLSIVVLVAGV